MFLTDPSLQSTVMGHYSFSENSFFQWSFSKSNPWGALDEPRRLLRTALKMSACDWACMFYISSNCSSLLVQQAVLLAFNFYIFYELCVRLWSAPAFKIGQNQYCSNCHLVHFVCKIHKKLSSLKVLPCNTTLPLWRSRKCCENWRWLKSEEC